MAHVYSDSRVRILSRMARDQEHKKWLWTATFAKTDNGYWLAWKPGKDGLVNQVDYLTPDHPKGKPAEGIETWGDGMTVDELIDYFESGDIDSDPPGVLNLFFDGE